MEDQLTTISNTVDSEKKPVDLDHALAISGLGCYNIKYCLVFGLFLIAAIVEPVGYSFVLPAARCDLEMSDGLRGFIGSIPYIGVVLTSFPWGYAVDTRGRKKVLIYSSLATGVFSILSAFMPDLITFTIFKFLTSLCLACPAAIPYTFIGEILPLRYRDVGLSITNALQIAGSGLVPLLAWGILPLDFRVDFGLYDFRPWRLLVIANASFFIIAAILLSFGPESPKFLMTQGKHNEALEVLRNIYAGNKRKSKDDYPVKQVIYHNIGGMEKTGFFTSLRAQSLPLMKPPYVKWLALNGFLLFGVFSALNGLIMWVPDLLNRVLTGSGAGLTACGVIAQGLNETANTVECIDTIETVTFVINTVANFSCAVIALAASSLVKYIGKKSLLVAVLILIGVFCVLVNFITQELVFAVLLSSIPVVGLAIGPINAFSVQIFPTNLRGMAVSLTMMIGRTGSVIGTNVAGLLLNAVCEVTFYLFGGLLIICGLLALLLPRSNKESRALKSKPKDITSL